MEDGLDPFNTKRNILLDGPWGCHSSDSSVVPQRTSRWCLSVIQQILVLSLTQLMHLNELFVSEPLRGCFGCKLAVRVKQIYISPMSSTYGIAYTFQKAIYVAPNIQGFMGSPSSMIFSCPSFISNIYVFSERTSQH